MATVLKPEPTRVVDTKLLAHADCRELRHAWRVEELQARPGGLVERRTTCLRGCGTSRVDTIMTRSGMLAKRFYLYGSKDYLIHGSGKIPVTRIRRLAVTAALRALQAR